MVADLDENFRNLVYDALGSHEQEAANEDPVVNCLYSKVVDEAINAMDNTRFLDFLSRAQE